MEEERGGGGGGEPKEFWGGGGGGVSCFRRPLVARCQTGETCWHNGGLSGVTEVSRPEASRGTGMSVGLAGSPWERSRRASVGEGWGRLGGGGGEGA